MRFIDMLPNQAVPCAAFLAAECAKVQQARVIVADNVARYYYEENPQERWDLNDFPCLAPPFDHFWIEWVNPKRIWSAEAGETIMPELARGLSAIQVRKMTAFEIYDLLRRDQKVFQDQVPQWVLRVLPWCKLDARPVIDGPAYALLIPLDQAGRALIGKNGKPLGIAETTAPLAAYDSATFEGRFAAQIYPGLLALSFMHVKNCAVLDNLPPPKLSRLHQIKTGRALKRYSTILIKATRRATGQTRASHAGNSSPFDIRRGFFRHYGQEWCAASQPPHSKPADQPCPVCGCAEGKGKLFGRHSGIYWTDELTTARLDRRYEVRK
jgi:hypothetical protein